ncbi:hypothetical protein AJ88_46530 [Mesorhizobium amorphae CCBAU 01583]|nr:hypothetical protein AJ88_46530 [Mesorhizobium amorphae CCBAU 01583]
MGRLALMAVAAFGLISFTACLLAMRFDLTAAFFLTPFRIFEFACGAALVWAKTPGRLSSDIAYTTGGLAILYAILQFDAGTSFPGWHAALPTLGTAMMIYGGRNAVAALPLKTAPALLIGRASYSIYPCTGPLSSSGSMQPGATSTRSRVSPPSLYLYCLAICFMGSSSVH